MRIVWAGKLREEWSLCQSYNFCDFLKHVLSTYFGISDQIVIILRCMFSTKVIENGEHPIFNPNERAKQWYLGTQCPYKAPWVHGTHDLGEILSTNLKNWSVLKTFWSKSCVFVKNHPILAQNVSQKLFFARILRWYFLIFVVSRAFLVCNNQFSTEFHKFWRVRARKLREEGSLCQSYNCREFLNPPLSRVLIFSIQFSLC